MRHYNRVHATFNRVHAELKRCCSKMCNIFRQKRNHHKNDFVEVSRTNIPKERKGILKSNSNRLTEGTPKRCIQLSNLVAQRVFEENDIISTPKRMRTVDLKNSQSISPPIIEPCQKLTTNYIAHKSYTSAQMLRGFCSGELNPMLAQRSTPVTSASTKSCLKLACEELHVSVVPQSLPCREKEYNDIYNFLRSKLEDECSSCMYISGVPGTGKTATVTSVIRALQAEVKQNLLQPFEFLEINGMRLTEPRQAYVHINQQLNGKTVPWEQAQILLEKRFNTSAPHRVITVLLVDELDILCNRRQDVVYNLLDWPTRNSARLVVITIANTMDLPERLLMGKVTSRIGLTRLSFQPYTYKQLHEIVTGRLLKYDSFKNDAIQLVARKVAAVSGDARRALDICRRATEIADAQNINIKDSQYLPIHVNLQHVQQALAEMITCAKVQAIKSCSHKEKNFLEAIVTEINRTGVEETTFKRVYKQIQVISGLKGYTIPTIGQALRISAQLRSRRLIMCVHSRNDIFQKILLNITMDDIHYALQFNDNYI